MNPNLRIFFKRSVYAVVFALIIIALYYGITNATTIDLSVIGGYVANGFLGLMMASMIVLIVGVVSRSVWTGIMNRADHVVLCCPDKNHNGVHIVASHYNPGGESTEGFSSFFHYYLDLQGKLYLSKKVDGEGTNIARSIDHLSVQTRLSLEPDKGKKIEIGSNTYDGKATDIVMQLTNGTLHFRGYDGLIDYGFKVTYATSGQRKWVMRI